MKIKITKSGFCFCIVMALYATASTMEYNDLVVIEAATKGQNK